MIPFVDMLPPVRSQGFGLCSSVSTYSVGGPGNRTSHPWVWRRQVVTELTLPVMKYQQLTLTLSYRYHTCPKLQEYWNGHFNIQCKTASCLIDWMILPLWNISKNNFLEFLPCGNDLLHWKIHTSTMTVRLNSRTSLKLFQGVRFPLTFRGHFLKRSTVFWRPKAVSCVWMLCKKACKWML